MPNKTIGDLPLLEAPSASAQLEVEQGGEGYRSPLEPLLHAVFGIAYTDGLLVRENVGESDAQFRTRRLHVAATNPGASDDSTQGFGIFSLWINTATSQVWICTAAAAGSATWLDLVGAAVPSGSPTAWTVLGSSAHTISDAAQGSTHGRRFRLTYDEGLITITVGTAAEGSECGVYLQEGVGLGLTPSGVTITTDTRLVEELGQGPRMFSIFWITSTLVHVSGELDVV